jgi:hypothetical protein
MECRTCASAQSYCPLDQADGGNVSGSGSREWRLMIFVVVEEIQSSDSVKFYVDQVHKNKGEISHPSREISQGF